MIVAATAHQGASARSKASSAPAEPQARPATSMMLAIPASSAGVHLAQRMTDPARQKSDRDRAHLRFGTRHTDPGSRLAGLGDYSALCRLVVRICGSGRKSRKVYPATPHREATAAGLPPRTGASVSSAAPMVARRPGRAGGSRIGPAAGGTRNPRAATMPRQTLTDAERHQRLG